MNILLALCSYSFSKLGDDRLNKLLQIRVQQVRLFLVNVELLASISFQFDRSRRKESLVLFLRTISQSRWNAAEASCVFSLATRSFASWACSKCERVWDTQPVSGSVSIRKRENVPFLFPDTDFLGWQWRYRWKQEKVILHELQLMYETFLLYSTRS